jgi:hypothetical protein
MENENKRLEPPDDDWVVYLPDKEMQRILDRKRDQTPFLSRIIANTFGKSGTSGRMKRKWMNFLKSENG